MKSRRLTIILGILITLAFTFPVLAGGWAVITLDHLPDGVIAGEPVIVRFAVRQHGKTLLSGLDASIRAKNPATGESFFMTASDVEGQAGFYQAVLEFPSSGNWQWSIQAFSADQPMPVLSVASQGITESQLPLGEPNLFLKVVTFAGLALAILFLALATRYRTRWSIVLVVAGLLAGGAGIPLVASNTQAETKVQDKYLQSGSQPETVSETGRRLFVAKGCVTCHTNQRIDPEFVDIHVDFGPDLTNHQAGPEYLRLWLKDPASVRPNTEMPDLGLDKGEIEALIAFLGDANQASNLDGKNQQNPPP